MPKYDIIPKTFDVVVEGKRYGVLERQFNGWVVKSLRYPIDSVCASSRDEALHLFFSNIDAFKKEAPND